MAAQNEAERRALPRSRPGSLALGLLSEPDGLAAKTITAQVSRRRSCGGRCAPNRRRHPGSSSLRTFGIRRSHNEVSRRPLLSARTPVKVAPHMPCSEYDRATHLARCSGATIHIDFSAVPALPESSADTNRVVLRPDGSIRSRSTPWRISTTKSDHTAADGSVVSSYSGRNGFNSRRNSSPAR